MDKRYGILVVSVTILVLCFAGTASATNWSVDGRGKADFIGIQAAINNAKDGDTIIVSSDVYYENVVVYKSVTLMGIGQPVVDAGGKGDAIALCADGITLIGFTATNSGSLKEGAAGIMVISCDNTIIGNNVSNNYWEGIRLDDSSSNNTITGNNVSNNNGNGISLASSSNNTITGNDVRGNRWGGIDLGYSSNNVITSNTFVNNGLSRCSYQNTVENNTVNGKPLVYLEDVSDHRVEDAGQVILVNCTNITVENMNLFNTHVGIELWETEDSIISNNTLRNNDDGVKLWNSSNNTIKGNNVSNNNYCGIHLYSSSNNNTITGNNVSNNNWDGISLASSSNNTITDNNVSNNNWDGISLASSSNNTITGNAVRGNREGGIDLGYSSNNVITSNTFVNDGLSGCSYQNTVENNTVNGKPLVYLEDVSDHRVEDAGQVILVNCNNITVEDLDLSNTHVGIELWETEDSIISNNTLCNNDDGVKLWNSSNNPITGNDASSNDDGIALSLSSNNTIKGNNVSNNNGDGIFLYFSSSNNTIKGNNISNNSYDGIHLHYSSNNIVTGNNVSSNNDVGIYLSSSSNNNSITGNNVNNNVDGIHIWVSSNNTIYFNNFINNTNNVDSYKSTNIWNSPLEITYTYDGATYVSYLGNYWDDYEERYLDAEKIDSTGILDTPYRIDEEEDNYPLMKPFENYNIIPTSAHT